MLPFPTWSPPPRSDRPHQDRGRGLGQYGNQSRCSRCRICGLRHSRVRNDPIVSIQKPRDAKNEYEQDVIGFMLSAPCEEAHFSPSRRNTLSASVRRVLIFRARRTARGTWPAPEVFDSSQTAQVCRTTFIVHARRPAGHRARGCTEALGRRQHTHTIGGSMSGYVQDIGALPPETTRFADPRPGRRDLCTVGSGACGDLAGADLLVTAPVRVSSLWDKPGEST